MVCTLLVLLLLYSASVLEAELGGKEYTVSDGEHLGRRFDGVGGLSGGGATSKLLVNYKEPRRSEILDFLFKPSFGAALQILKVEIGGDSQSTDGTESSHMHTQFEENYNRGYEWWIMKEAKKRNENIKLYGLAWAFPGWLNDHPGSKTPTPYGKPKLFVKYLVNWVVGAKKYHNLTIDYLGIWNERTYNITAIKMLRRGLDAANQSHVEIVAADGESWDIANDMQKDKELSNSIAVIGAHYPGTYSSSTAKATNKPLWASEDYSTFNDDVGGGCWARTINQNYVNGNISATISWNLIASYYNALPWNRSSLMTANEPWSGHYQVSSPIWVTAHTTQFTSNDGNWHYLKEGVGHFEKGGSYVALTNKTHLTIVMETMSHDHSICVRPPLPPYNITKQNVTFRLAGTFTNVTELHFWHSKLNFDGQESELFKRGDDITVTNSKFTITLDIDMVVTVTTVIGGKVGPYPQPPPPSGPFPLPYLDHFNNYSISEEPYNLAQQIGVFEEKSGGYIEQMVTQMPIYSCPYPMYYNKLTRPVGIIGSQTWSNINVAVRAMTMTNATSAKGVFVGARVSGTYGCRSQQSGGIFFFVFPQNGSFALVSGLNFDQVISQGPFAMDPDKWFTMSLFLHYDLVIASINNSTVIHMKLPNYKRQIGFAAIGTYNFGSAFFDDLLIIPTSNDELNV